MDHQEAVKPAYVCVQTFDTYDKLTTSSGRALAQKISIRLSVRFQRCKFVEVHCQNLFSKFYSEGGRLVSSLFHTVNSMTQEPDTFVVVFIGTVLSRFLAHHRPNLFI